MCNIVHSALYNSCDSHAELNVISGLWGYMLLVNLFVLESKRQQSVCHLSRIPVLLFRALFSIHCLPHNQQILQVLHQVSWIYLPYVKYSRGPPVSMVTQPQTCSRCTWRHKFAYANFLRPAIIIHVPQNTSNFCFFEHKPPLGSTW